MKVICSNEITITEPDAKIVRWAVDNLKVDNPEYAKKKALGLWTRGTPKEIQLYRGDLKRKLVLPHGTKKSLINHLNDCKDWTIEDDYAQNGSVSYGPAISLYGYQEDAMAILEARGGGILQSKAGSGKTRTGLALIQSLGKKTLWLTHTNELLNQSYNAASEFISKDLLGKITAGKLHISEGITFATVQTLCKADLTSLKYEWDVIIVDECHRCAGTMTKVTMFSKILNALAAKHKYGLSATLHRADNLIKCTYALLGGISYTVPDSVVNTMQVTVRRVNTGTVMSRECLDTDGTLVYSKLINYLAFNQVRNEGILKDIYQLYQNKHSIILLSDRVEQLNILSNMLQIQYNINVAVLHGKVKKTDRERALADMRTGKLRILLATYSIAKEGLDIPCLDRLLLATPVKDYAIVVQSVGRVARVAEGKAFPEVLDYVDAIGFLEKMYKHRCTHYRKDGCKIVQ